MSEHDLRVADGGTEHTRAPFPIGDFIFAGVGIVSGIVVAFAASSIRIPPTSTGAFGPRTFPYAVAALVIIASVWVMISILRGERAEAEDGEDVDTDSRTDWVTVGVILGLFVVFGVLIQPVGWPFAVLVLFAGTAWKLGAKRWWMAGLIGLVMGLLTQYLFGTLLGISLPAGPLLDWIPIFNG